MRSKAQGAVEYLLLLGGAVLVVAVVLSLLVKLTKTGKRTTSEAEGSYSERVEELKGEVE